MLDMNFIKTNRADVERAIRDKGVGIDLDALMALDAEVRGAKGEIEALRASRNAISARFKDAAPEEKAALGAEAKAAGRPWDMGKGFDHAAPIGDLVRMAEVPTRAALELRVNGAVRQRGDLSQLIWSVPETIAALSRLVRLAPGDLIFTGTPEGVAAVARGDVLEGTIEGVGPVRTRIV